MKTIIKNVNTKMSLHYNLNKREILGNYDLYLMLIPFIAFYIIFLYRPMWGLQIAFKDYSLFKGIKESPWVGFENFKFFLTGPYFVRTLKNTFIINIYAIIFGFPAPIILAVLLNEARNRHFKKMVQTLTYLPHFISVVVIAGIVTNFLSPTTGLINTIIAKLGGERIYFLVKPEYFRTIFTTMNIWRNAGFGAIIYLAALSGIDVQLYESAKIDGANKWQQIWNITIPGIIPTIVILLVLRIGRLLSVGYEKIILLYQPATYETSDVISTYVYRSGLTEGRYDLATAVGLINSVCALILVWSANKISNKLTETGLW